MISCFQTLLSNCKLRHYTQESELTEVLTELYGTVDNCELYTGLLCEYNLGNTGAMLPHTAHMCSLPLNIIAADKWFSKRSLLESNTYTKWGLEYSAKASLAALLREHTTLYITMVGRCSLTPGFRS